ncbi:N/A [soil metagenome]
MRCLTLANQFKILGANVHFVCRYLPDYFASLILKSGHAILRLALVDEFSLKEERSLETDEPIHTDWLGVSWQFDAEETSRVLSSIKNLTWLVVDHYALDARWESALKSTANQILVIDDLADRKHDCDLILDQNFYLDQNSRYIGKIGNKTIKLFGPQYALLRPEFLQVNDVAVKRKRLSASPNRINICFGGVDATGETLKALNALDKTFFYKKMLVDIVVGPGNLQLNEIKDWVIERPYLKLHVAPDQLAQLMSEADVAIGAAGSMSWERACLGLPSIAIAIAKNQERLAMDAGSVGMHLFLGSSETVDSASLIDAFKLLISNTYLRQSFVRNSKKMTDGKGAIRVARRIVKSQINLRNATLADCEATYEWRNAIENRMHAHDINEIPFEDHQKWFAASLNQHDRHLLIGYDAIGIVGVLRYDRHPDHWLTSVYLIPGRHGAGFGTDLLEQGIQWMKSQYGEACHILAEIKMDNMASQKVFQQAGYIPRFITYTVA